ncbi:MAG TPA: hypothetical protein VG275_01455 [Solirubrobacteraceae bacterium]|nr:hypothetical protein [Solirubrobacteraceae bacterium]
MVSTLPSEVVGVAPPAAVGAGAVDGAGTGGVADAPPEGAVEAQTGGVATNGLMTSTAASITLTRRLTGGNEVAFATAYGVS